MFPTKTFAIVFTVFIVAFSSQAYMWLSWEYPDDDEWQQEAIGLLHGATPDFDGLVLVHPGTALLVPSAALIAIGVPPKISVNAVIALFIALSAALITWMCIMLRPQSLWWLGAALLLVFNPLYSLATAPGAVAGALVPLFVMLVFYIRSQPVISQTMLVLLGVCAGVLLATRIDTGLAVCFFTFWYLLYLVGFRVWIFAVVSPLTLFLLDPYLWSAPIEHVSSIIDLVRANTVAVLYDSPSYTERALMLGVLAALIAVAASFRSGFTSVPKDFVYYIVPMFLIVCIAISFAMYRPVRYYFPFGNAMELFLPLLVFDIFENPRLRFSQRMQNALKYSFLLLLVAARGVPLLILL